MEPLYIVLIVVSSLIILFFLSTLLMFTRNYIFPKNYSYEHAKNWMSAHNAYDNFDEIERIEYIITLKSGYKLNARFFKNKEESNKYVIIMHGLTVNQEYDSKYALIFLKAGYNVITYDSRGHGKNKRCKVTMGIRESKDFLEVVEDSYNRYGKDIYLGAQGESMGGGTLIYSLRYNPNIKFAVVDCPFEKVKETTEFNLKNVFHLPLFLGKIGNFLSKLIYGVDLYSIDVKENMNNYKGPIAIFDGDNDMMVPIEASKNIYDAYNSYKEIHWYKGSYHAFSLIDYKEEYTKDLINFLRKIENM